MSRFLALTVLALAACAGTQAAPATPDAPNTPVATAPAAAPAAQASARSIDIATFKADREAGKVPVVFDVRTPAEYAEGHVEGAILVPLQELDQRMAEFEPHKDAEVYLICRSGARSGRAAQALTAAGYDTVNIEGGTMAWIAAGNPVVQ